MFSYTYASAHCKGVSKGQAVGRRSEFSAAVPGKYYTTEVNTPVRSAAGGVKRPDNRPACFAIRYATARREPGDYLKTAASPRVSPRAIKEMMVSEMDQVFMVSGTDMLKYSLTIQKPPSLT